MPREPKTRIMHGTLVNGAFGMPVHDWRKVGAGTFHAFHKVASVLKRGIHVLVADLFPPGKHDPAGMHGQIWTRYTLDAYDLPTEQPLTLSSYRAEYDIEAYIEHLSFGDPLADMPLFLDEETYIYVPLETTYQSAFSDMPNFWRDVIEGNQPPV